LRRAGVLKRRSSNGAALKQTTDPTLRRHALQATLLSTVDLLKRRRACEIPEGYIDDYVALNWLEWNGGGLRLTETGHNICRQVTLHLDAER
jgi:hypothetical protein